MAIACDILAQLQHDFPAADAAGLIERLEFASSSERVQRCIVWAARGHPWYFEFLCQLARIDYRDVILVAEYERFGEHLYDFSQPIPAALLTRLQAEEESRERGRVCDTELLSPDAARNCLQNPSMTREQGGENSIRSHVG